MSDPREQRLRERFNLESCLWREDAEDALALIGEQRAELDRLRALSPTPRLKLSEAELMGDPLALALNDLQHAATRCGQLGDIVALTLTPRDQKEAQAALVRANELREACWNLAGLSPSPGAPTCYPHDWKTVGPKHIKCKRCGAEIERVPAPTQEGKRP